MNRCGIYEIVCTATGQRYIGQAADTRSRFISHRCSLAAGNQGADACSYSPARVGAGTNNGIITTAATTSSDAERSSSNYGACVDVWAPGASVLSTRMGGGTTTMSGTSMAAPHVGGGAALYLSSHTSASPSEAEGALTSGVASLATLSKDGRSILLERVSGF